jgi:hypothetical protein
MPDTGEGVRPTRRCVDDLEVSLPNLGTPLEHVDHVLVKKAQRLPDEVVAGAAERVVSLDDRLWWKVKADNWRGAAHELADRSGAPEESKGAPAARGRWWIGAAGVRQDDSPQRDFYRLLQAECEAARKAENRAGRSGPRASAYSDGLLPTAWDWRRLVAEVATYEQVTMRTTLRRMAVKSLQTGKVVSLEFDRYRVRIAIRAANGHEAYLAISAEGAWDQESFARLLDSFPGIGRDDWQPEPGGPGGLTPDYGEILWSTILPPDLAGELMDEYEPVDVSE